MEEQHDTDPAFHAIFDALCFLFSGGGCPIPGAIGECAAGSFVCTVRLGDSAWNNYDYAVYVWDDTFNDCAAIEKIARSCGADDIVISHVLHDTMNDDANGRAIDGSRQWSITVMIPTAEGCKPDRAPEPMRGPAGAPAAREAEE